ncbi:Protein APCDD1 [Anabarilius grahami]|uniref:Protein APCDD1 n=1 Tax=Anabarilius grahami TaxID=495550 RepID=A0A3N0YGM5_ANAGA|nr:Protein APCDD1 [Anabarilius grahami]
MVRWVSLADAHSLQNQVSVSVCVLMVSAGPVLLDKRSVCHSTLKHLRAGQQVTVHIPPDISGHWVSDSCEVRPGPEFITRSYRFYPNHTFQALQFYYQDNHCTQPSYSLLIRGSVRPQQASWVVRGGTVSEYQLSSVQLLCHGPATADVQRRLESSCDLRQPLRPGLTYELWAEGRDCTRGLDFSMQELQLMRLERRDHHGDPSRQAEELFLGDVHTERAQRRLHQPSGYQTPLQSAKTDGRRCGICQIVASADLHHPPVLPPQSDRPVRLHGNWVSARCEARPGVLFLTRRLTFQEDSRTWEGQYEHFSDPVCRHPTFSISASGRYTRGAPSAAVMGAVEFTFTGLVCADATVIDKNARFARQAQSLYKTNFPRKNPMKMAAMTTSSEGSDLEAGSLLSIAEDFEAELSY